MANTPVKSVAEPVSSTLKSNLERFVRAIKPSQNAAPVFSPEEISQFAADIDGLTRPQFRAHVEYFMAMSAFLAESEIDLENAIQKFKLDQRKAKSMQQERQAVKAAHAAMIQTRELLDRERALVAKETSDNHLKILFLQKASLQYDQEVIAIEDERRAIREERAMLAGVRDERESLRKEREEERLRRQKTEDGLMAIVALVNGQKDSKPSQAKELKELQESNKAEREALKKEREELGKERQDFNQERQKLEEWERVLAVKSKVLAQDAERLSCGKAEAVEEGLAPEEAHHTTSNDSDNKSNHSSPSSHASSSESTSADHAQTSSSFRQAAEEEATLLYCVCQKTMAEQKPGQIMAECDAREHQSDECSKRCHGWYHLKCLGLPNDIAEETNSNGRKWLCPACIEDQDTRGLADDEKDEETLGKCARCETHHRHKGWVTCTIQAESTKCQASVGFWHIECAKMAKPGWTEWTDWACPDCIQAPSPSSSPTPDELEEEEQDKDKPPKAPKPGPSKRKRDEEDESDEDDADDQPAPKRARPGAWTAQEEAGVVKAMEGVITGAELEDGKRVWGDARFTLAALVAKRRGVTTRSSTAIRMAWLKKLRARSEHDERDFDEKHPEGGAERQRKSRLVVGSGLTKKGK
ncbi:MAG: hypothetical protein M1814_003490 [Vezdaea aestivalis]|nr:MAG: hypothetical protein M1814_003490 [Vezdaea aestivalis]